MKEFLNTIRQEENTLKLKNKIINTILIFILGVVLGIFSKWLDNLSIDNKLWWIKIIEKLDLNNFFQKCLFGYLLLLLFQYLVNLL